MLMPKINWIILTIILFEILSTHAASSTLDDVKSQKLKIAVIGAGASGLAATKVALDHKHNVDVYEQGGNLGGIWWYTDDIGEDKYKIKIHTPMYQGLRTNSPYQTMDFPDWSYPNNTPSYPTQQMVLNYLKSYAEHFELDKHIKFHHQVIKVSAVKNKNNSSTKWILTVKDAQKNITAKSVVYDAIFICTGVSSSPNIPKMKGADIFIGKIIHSHDYRRADKFKGEDVLVIGAGASANDIIDQLENIANHVTCSQRNSDESSKEVSESNENSTDTSLVNQQEQSLVFKNEVKHFTPNGAVFADGSERNFTVVIYATGYRYKYPFLSNKIGISIDENCVETLYKQVLNIQHPTMAFIGIPQVAVNNRMYDLQARFALKFISGAINLPTECEMFHDAIVALENHEEEGYEKREFHMLGLEHKRYYKMLSDTAQIKNIPDYIADIFTDALKCQQIDPEFRENKYIIQKDKTFIKLKEETSPVLH